MGHGGGLWARGDFALEKFRHRCCRLAAPQLPQGPEPPGAPDLERRQLPPQHATILPEAPGRGLVIAAVGAVLDGREPLKS